MLYSLHKIANELIRLNIAALHTHVRFFFVHCFHSTQPLRFSWIVFLREIPYHGFVFRGALACTFDGNLFVY